jgi:hypothetical protein
MEGMGKSNFGGLGKSTWLFRVPDVAEIWVTTMEVQYCGTGFSAGNRLISCARSDACGRRPGNYREASL